MGSGVSKPKPGDNPQVHLSQDPQVRVRKHEEGICPLHPICKVTALCSECKILVCLGCITSHEHKGHTFENLKDCSRRADDKITERLKDIEDHNTCIPQLGKELSSVRHRISQIQGKSKTIDRTSNTTDQKRFKTYHDALNLCHSNYEILLKSYENQVSKKRKSYINIIKTGSEIPTKLNIPELNNKKQLEDVMENLQYETERVSKIYNELLYTTVDAYDTGINLMVISSFDYDSPEYDSITPEYDSITPISTDKAWVGEYDSRNGNELRLITSTGKILRHFETDEEFYRLSIHTTTGQLYGAFLDDTVRSINTTTGVTTTVIHSQCRPERITVTHDNHVLVGSRVDLTSVLKYKLTGELVHQSTEKFRVQDIDHCPNSNRVLLSCSTDGISVLDDKLNSIHTFTGLSEHGRRLFPCYSAVFDNSGNIIVSDLFNREIYILDSKHLDLKQKLNIDGLSCPKQIRLNQNILWVRCEYSRKIMRIMMP